MEAKTDRVVVETNALSLRWSFGFNTAVPSAVHSLATPKRTALFYVSSHTGVIHDTDQDAQHLLQGHCNPITTVCVSRDKRWIATADAGDESMIVVWDSVKATPVKILSQPYAAGVAAMDMSTDSMFLVTLSHGTPQQIAIWEWTVATKDPAISAVIGIDHEIQRCVRFNGVDVRDIVSNGDKEVIFWNWTDEALVAFHPPRGISKLKKAVGDLTQSMFLPYTTKAVTSTSTGHVVLWDYPVSELVQSSGRDAIKILKISKSGIRLLSTVLDRYVVCGCVDGAVRFFDFQFRVVAWFEDIQSGQITSISFAETPVPAAAPSNTANVSMDDFQVPDFVVGTAQGKVILLDSKTMEEIEVEKRRGTLLVQGFDGDVFALDGHPHLPLFAVGTTAGTLQIWDIDDRVISASRNFMDVPSTDGHDERGKKKEATRKLLRGTKLLSSVGTDATDDNTATKKKKGSLADLTSGQRLDEDDATLNAAVASAVSGGVVRPSADSINNPYRIQCIKYAPHGNVIAVGFANGSLRLVSSQETLYSADAPLQTGASRLKDICSFKHSTGAIVDISWSADALYLCTADVDQCVGLYRFYHRDEEKDKPMEWIFVGKYQSHYAPITSVYFKEVEEFDTPTSTPVDDKKEAKKSSMRSTNVLASSSSAAGAGSDGKRDDKDDDKDVYYQFVAKPKAAPLVPRLFSLGEDRVLQEYDVASCSIRGGLRLKSSCSVEQVGTPTAMVCVPGASGHRPGSSFPSQWWNNTPGKDDDKAAATAAATTAKKDDKKDGKEASKKETKDTSLPPSAPDVFIMANDEYKLKVWQLGPDRRDGQRVGVATDIRLNHSKSGSQLLAARTRTDDERTSGSAATAGNNEKVCRQTVLAPTYGGPINKLFMLPKRDGKKIAPSPFLVYSTFEKIVGLIKLPLDGNPNKAMALVAHPGQISCVVCSFDGKYLLTAGGADRAVNLWAVNTSALDASITLGGAGLEPYMGLLEGGKNGDFFQDLLDYFYYAQLRSQGLSTTSARQITGLIPLGEVVNLMRALGYYPTQQQMIDIRTEIELSQAHLKPGSRLKDKVDLEQFIKLYVNYRPVFGLNKRHFEDSFAALLAGAADDDIDDDAHTSTSLARTKKKLQSLSRDDLISCLQSLGERMSHDEIKECLDALIGPPTAPGPKGTTVVSAGSSISSLSAVITPGIFAQEVLGFDDYETDDERAEKDRQQRRDRDRAIEATRQANELARADAEREARRGKDWKKEARDKRAKVEAAKKEKEDKRRASAVATGGNTTTATSVDDAADDDDDAIDWEGDPAEMGAFVLGKVVEETTRSDRTNAISS